MVFVSLIIGSSGTLVYSIHSDKSSKYKSINANHLYLIRLSHTHSIVTKWIAINMHHFDWGIIRIGQQRSMGSSGCKLWSVISVKVHDLSLILLRDIQHLK